MRHTHYRQVGIYVFRVYAGEDFSARRFLRVQKTRKEAGEFVRQATSAPVLPGFIDRGSEKMMFCPQCGKECSAGTKFCASCGASFDAFSAPSQATTPTVMASETMTFGKSISTCLSKYVDFKGRASRPEYWWFYLFTMLLSWGAAIIDPSQIVSGLVSIAFLLPSLAAAARRLHDTNRSGWWLLIAFTVIGLIPLIIWLASKSNEQANDYGNSN